MNRSVINRFSNLLKIALEKTKGSLIITPSRRTGKENIRTLCENLSDLPVYIWNGIETNPYYGILALSDALVVTCDSINMISEACATGKPVHVVHLDGGNRKFREFHDNMQTAGYTRTFEGRLEHWNYKLPDDTTNIAKRVHELLNTNVCRTTST